MFKGDKGKGLLGLRSRRNGSRVNYAPIAGNYYRIKVLLELVAKHVSG
jgi:hypothetical protein